MVLPRRSSFCQMGNYRFVLTDVMQLNSLQFLAQIILFHFPFTAFEFLGKNHFSGGVRKLHSKLQPGRILHPLH